MVASMKFPTKKVSPINRCLKKFSLSDL